MQINTRLPFEDWEIASASVVTPCNHEAMVLSSNYTIIFIFFKFLGLMWVPFPMSQSIVACGVLNLTRDYSDVTLSAMASQITSITIVCSTVYSGADQRKYQSSASLAFVSGIHRWPFNSPHKGPVTRKKFPLDDAIMVVLWIYCINHYSWSWIITFAVFCVFLEIVHVFRFPT